MTFGSEPASVTELYATWRDLLNHLSVPPPTNWPAFEQFTARDMTRRQCEFFDRVIATGKS
jgi:hypothetical protein